MEGTEKINSINRHVFVEQSETGLGHNATVKFGSVEASYLHEMPDLLGAFLPLQVREHYMQHGYDQVVGGFVRQYLDRKGFIPVAIKFVEDDQIPPYNGNTPLDTATHNYMTFPMPDDWDDRGSPNVNRQSHRHLLLNEAKIYGLIQEHCIKKGIELPKNILKSYGYYIEYGKDLEIKNSYLLLEDARRGENGAQYSYTMADHIDKFVKKYSEGDIPTRELKLEYIRDVRRTVELYTPIAGELDKLNQGAYGKKIVFRDLKPSNIVLKEDEDGEVIPVLLDFGLATALEDREDLIMHKTPNGTPMYMAPEQSAGIVHLTSDQYALGAMLFEGLGADCFVSWGCRDLRGAAVAQEIRENKGLGALRRGFWGDLPIRVLMPEEKAQMERIAGKFMTEDYTSRFESSMRLCLEFDAVLAHAQRRLEEEGNLTKSA